jgi:hypothetical protein
MTSKRIDSTTTVINDNVEVKSDQSIEPVVTNEIGRVAAEEAFMNELVLIEVAESTDENQPNHVVLSVNAVTQPVFRGVPTLVKRKYVEVLARCKESKYSQHTTNPNEPDRIEMRQRTALAYPFQVLEDKNPKGKAWLAAVLAEQG